MDGEGKKEQKEYRQEECRNGRRRRSKALKGRSKTRGLPAFPTCLLTSPSLEEEPCDEKYRLSLCAFSGVVGSRVDNHRSRAFASVSF
jgi:hypothetical protein